MVSYERNGRREFGEWSGDSRLPPPPKLEVTLIKEALFPLLDSEKPFLLSQKLRNAHMRSNSLYLDCVLARVISKIINFVGMLIYSGCPLPPLMANDSERKNFN